jgi:ADP-heptose:LPS heptosyltransferase
VIFTSFSQSPHPPALICELAEIPLRLGESKETDSVLTTAVPPAPDEIHQVDRNLRLLEAVGFSIRDRSLALRLPPAESPIPHPYLLLNPWTSCQSRNYDSDRFAQAARQLAELTHCSVVVTGVEKDRDRSAPVLEILGDRGIDAIGKTSLSELTTLIAHARLLLTNNTSTMHIADATRTPTVVMFAGTELECQWQPRSTRVKLLRRPTPCSPCYAFTCPYSLECLDIPIEQVVAAGLELLDAAKNSDRLVTSH